MSKKTGNIISAVQAWIGSQEGQTFLNYAYSWGAAVVILGALFKITHISYADIMLFIGMGTEVVVFFISGFDVPKSTDDGGTVTGVPQQPQTVQAPAEPQMGVMRRIVLGTDMEDDEEMQEMKKDLDRQRKTVQTVQNVFEQQLTKLKAQLESIDLNDEQLRVQSMYLGKINRIYNRILKAMTFNTDEQV